jgi:ketosteroid isomerase-like protein
MDERAETGGYFNNKYMIVFLKGSFLIVSIILSTWLFAGQWKTSETDAELLKVHTDFHNALLNHDTDLIRSILADEIQLVVRGQSKLISEDDYLAREQEAIESIILVDINSGQINIETIGNDARIEFILRIRFKSDSSIPTEHLGRYIYSYKKNETGWQITSIKLL